MTKLYAMLLLALMVSATTSGTRLRDVYTGGYDAMGSDTKEKEPPTVFFLF